MTSTNRVVANALMSLEELLKKQGLSRAEFDKMMKEMKDKGASAVHYMRGKDGRLLFKADGTTIGNAISEKAVNGAEVENTRTLPVSKQAWTECELKGIEAMKKYLASHKGVLPRTIKEVDDVLGIIPDIDVAEKQNVMSYFKYGRGKSLVANSMKDDVAKIAKMVGRSLTPNEERSARILLEAGEPASRIARSIQATAPNAATNAKFKAGDKAYVHWFSGEDELVDVISYEPKGDYYIVRGEDGQLAHPKSYLLYPVKNSRACNSTNAIVRKAMNSTALNFSPGDKVSIVDTDIRYGGDKGEVVRKDGFRYVVRLTSRQDKPEVLLQPNQLKASNSEDAQGHEHGSDGKFASKGGGSDGGDSYEDPKTKRMKERLAKMREKNEALRKDIEARKAGLAQKKADTEKMRAEVMKANVEKWKAAHKSKNSVVQKALNARARNDEQFHTYLVPVLRKGVKDYVTIERVADEETAKKLVDVPSFRMIGVTVDESRPVKVAKNAATARNAISDKEREYTRLYELAQKNITFHAAKGDSAKVTEWKRRADEYKRLAQEATNAARNADNGFVQYYADSYSYIPKVGEIYKYDGKRVKCTGVQKLQRGNDDRDRFLVEGRVVG